MKTKLFLIAVLVFGLAGIGQMAWATEEIPVAEAQIVSPIQIRGVMEESLDGLSLVGPESTYQLRGYEAIEGIEDDTLKDMIGKLVYVNGDLERNEDDLIIHVKDVQLIN